MSDIQWRSSDTLPEEGDAVFLVWNSGGLPDYQEAVFYRIWETSGNWEVGYGGDTTDIAEPDYWCYRHEFHAWLRSAGQ